MATAGESAQATGSARIESESSRAFRSSESTRAFSKGLSNEAVQIPEGSGVGRGHGRGHLYLDRRTAWDRLSGP